MSQVRGSGVVKSFWAKKIVENIIFQYILTYFGVYLSKKANKNKEPGSISSRRCL